jgi:putative oxidoreductase
MKECCAKLAACAEKLWDPLALIIRLYMANIFFKSGWLKFEDLINHQWAHTVGIFRDVTPVPYLPAELAAPLAMAGELGLSALLALGLFARFGAFGLLVMTCIIEWSFQVNDPDYTTNPQHPLWAMLFAVIAIKGAGKWSVDGFLKR